MAAKWRLTRLLYERHWNRQQILDLYHVIDWMMRLPPELERTLQAEIRAFEEERKMGWITSAERIGREDGLQQGREEGRRAARELLAGLLVERFGAPDEAIRQRLAAADAQTLFAWTRRIVSARSLDEVFR